MGITFYLIADLCNKLEIWICESYIAETEELEVQKYSPSFSLID